jgi:glycosyltransferase involved in cell wall biosynthesis
MLGLQNDSSVLMPGWKEDVAEWFAISDLCVFPSEREGMPVCLMEALCMGVPVVTSDARGCRDVVRDGIDGVILKDALSTLLALRIKGIVQSPDELKVMQENALKRRSCFDRNLFVQEHLVEVGKHI